MYIFYSVKSSFTIDLVRLRKINYSLNIQVGLILQTCLNRRLELHIEKHSKQGMTKPISCYWPTAALVHCLARHMVGSLPNAVQQLHDIQLIPSSSVPYYAYYFLYKSSMGVKTINLPRTVFSPVNLFRRNESSISLTHNPNGFQFISSRHIQRAGLIK